MAKGTAKRAKRAGCKKGYYKSRSGALKGRCVKRAQHTVVRGKGRKVLRGAARLAQMCKGNKGSAYKACMSHALDGIGSMSRRKRSGASRRRLGMIFTPSFSKGKRGR